MKTFEEIGVNELLRRAVEELGYEHPMPVQEEVIPYLLGEKNDVIALAQTGTGKTAAFGIPVLQKVSSEDHYPQAVILAPTRELCLQITNDLKSYSRYLPEVRIQAVYGGANIETQIRALMKGAQVIVATPGRLIDLMNRGVARLDRVKSVVLDEADEMLNMGFSESIDAILERVPAERNTLLFSATMSKEVEKIAKSYLHDYKEMVVGSRNEGAEKVKHIYYYVQTKDKYVALKRLVDYYPQIYAIIFCRTRRETQEVADNLARDGYNAEALHGELSQAQRDLTMKKFRNHNVQFLVATDVAARGLDVNDLTHVINYGLPDDVESYTHRSGRTGRAGKRGTSISIINIRDRAKVRAIERIISKKFEVGVLPTAEQICSKQLYNVIDKIEAQEVDENLIAPFMAEVLPRLEWMSKEDLIKKMVSETFGTFLEYYKHAPTIVQPTDRAGKNGDRPVHLPRDRRNTGGSSAQKGYKRLFINLGKRDNFYAREIINLVNRHVKGNVQMGRIDLTQNCSFFEVAEHDAVRVLKEMRRVKVGDRTVVVDKADKGGAGQGEGGGSRGGGRGGYRNGGSRNGGGNYGGRNDNYGGKSGSNANRGMAQSYKSGKASKKKNVSEQTRDEFGENDWRQFFKK